MEAAYRPWEARLMKWHVIAQVGADDYQPDILPQESRLYRDDHPQTEGRWLRLAFRRRRDGKHASSAVKSCPVSAVVIRADGTRQDPKRQPSGIGIR